MARANTYERILQVALHRAAHHVLEAQPVTLHSDTGLLRVDPHLHGNAHARRYAVSVIELYGAADHVFGILVVGPNFGAHRGREFQHIGAGLGKIPADAQLVFLNPGIAADIDDPHADLARTHPGTAAGHHDNGDQNHDGEGRDQGSPHFSISLIKFQIWLAPKANPAKAAAAPASSAMSLRTFIRFKPSTIAAMATANRPKRRSASLVMLPIPKRQRQTLALEVDLTVSDVIDNCNLSFVDKKTLAMRSFSYHLSI
jgi:hypothetical protein